MILQTIIVLWISVYPFIKTVEQPNNARRVKRVVDGEEISVSDRNSSYKVVKYFVLVANSWNCQAKGNPSEKNYVCSLKPENIECGGSLLTPQIVQTSCACIGSFPGPEVWRPGRAKQGWENQYFIFPGRNDIRNMSKGLRSKKTFVHQKCAQMFTVKSFQRLITHDSGLILLESSTEEGEFADRNKYFFRYADVFETPDLVKQWEDSMFQLPTCLGVGFGLSKRSHVHIEKSWVLRHSWASLREYWRCYFYTMMDSTVARNGSFNYSEMATWGCMVNVPNKTQYLTAKDIGGPVSCNNYYYGVYSESFDIKEGLEKDNVLQLLTPNAFTVCENSAEYRPLMISSLENLKSCADTFKPSVPPETPPEPISAKYFLFDQHGSSVSMSPNCEKSSLLQLLIALFNTSVLFIQVGRM